MGISSFDCFSDGMLRGTKYWKYRGQAELRVPRQSNLFHHRTRTSRNVETNESKNLKLGEIQEQRLIHDFLIHDYIRKFILRLLPEMNEEENRMLLDSMTNEAVKDMKAMKAIGWKEISLQRFLI